MRLGLLGTIWDCCEWMKTAFLTFWTLFDNAGKRILVLRKSSFEDQPTDNLFNQFVIIKNNSKQPASKTENKDGAENQNVEPIAIFCSCWKTMTNMRIHHQRIWGKNKIVFWPQAAHIENQHESLSIKHGPREEIRRTPPPPPRSRGPFSYTLDVVYPRLPWPTGDSKHPISSEQDFRLTPLCLISLFSLFSISQRTCACIAY